MRFGVCTDIENIKAAQKLGFEYIEVNASAISALSEEKFEKKRTVANSADIGCECFNVLFPGTITLLGSHATDWSEVESYLHHTFGRVKELGGKIVVFGSGRCRSYPEDMSFFEAHRRLCDVTAKIGGIAAGYDLTITVEPLNQSESNMICTVAEGAMLVAQVNAENVRLLADGYHMFADGEPLENIKRAGNLAHAHIATQDGRKFPTVRDEILEGFFVKLRAIGYDERVSIEGRTDNFEEDSLTSLALLRKLTQER